MRFTQARNPFAQERVEELCESEPAVLDHGKDGGEESKTFSHALRDVGICAVEDPLGGLDNLV